MYLVCQSGAGEKQTDTILPKKVTGPTPTDTKALSHVPSHQPNYPSTHPPCTHLQEYNGRCVTMVEWWKHHGPKNKK